MPENVNDDLPQNGISYLVVVCGIVIIINASIEFTTLYLPVETK